MLVPIWLTPPQVFPLPLFAASPHRTACTHAFGAAFCFGAPATAASSTAPCSVTRAFRPSPHRAAPQHTAPLSSARPCCLRLLVERTGTARRSMARRQSGDKTRPCSSVTRHRIRSLTRVCWNGQPRLALPPCLYLPADSSSCHARRARHDCSLAQGSLLRPACSSTSHPVDVARFSQNGQAPPPLPIPSLPIPDSFRPSVLLSRSTSKENYLALPSSATITAPSLSPSYIASVSPSP